MDVDPSPTFGTVTLEPIGVIHTPFGDKASAPRQPPLAASVRGRVELFAGHGYEDALDGLASFDTIWLVFLFHHAVGHRRLKVQPPRASRRLGVFATRSPHRPNPIGLSAVRLESIDGLTLTVSGVDMVDGTPLLDIKPYLPYADALPDASSGWLDAERDKGPRYVVAFEERAREQLAWLRDEHQVELEERVVTLLSTGPEPHAYRRIRRAPDGSSVLAIQSWRLQFAASGRDVTVRGVASGYRPAELATPRAGEPSELSIHRAFEARFEAHARR
jgi:tRNA-Thr(GGU) m(6)t(6)A37 methyltransferase TsaA